MRKKRRRSTSPVRGQTFPHRVPLSSPIANINDPTDLKEQYEVKVEEGLDTFVVIDGLPVVPEDSRQKLVKFLLRKLNTVGHTAEDAVFMPLNDKGMTEG